jgi:hypothetical protein
MTPRGTGPRPGTWVTKAIKSRPPVGGSVGQHLARQVGPPHRHWRNHNRSDFPGQRSGFWVPFWALVHSHRVRHRVGGYPRAIGKRSSDTRAAGDVRLQGAWGAPDDRCHLVTTAHQHSQDGQDECGLQALHRSHEGLPLCPAPCYPMPVKAPSRGRPPPRPLIESRHLRRDNVAKSYCTTVTPHQTIAAQDRHTVFQSGGPGAVPRKGERPAQGRRDEGRVSGELQ